MMDEITQARLHAIQATVRMNYSGPGRGHVLGITTINQQLFDEEFRKRGIKSGTPLVVLPASLFEAILLRLEKRDADDAEFNRKLSEIGQASHAG